MCASRCVGVSVVVACAWAATAWGQETVAITGFEEFLDGDEVIWQEPSFSGSTQGILEGTDFLGNPWDLAQVQPFAMFTGLRSCEIYFLWVDPTNSNGLAAVRATTAGAANLERPSIHLGGQVEFKMAVTAFQYDAIGNSLGPQIPAGNASVLLCMGVEETGRAFPLGETDAGSGDIELVYLPGSEVIPAAGTNGLAPWPPGGKRFPVTGTWPPPVGDWQTVTFDLAGPGAIRGFANDGFPPETAGDGLLDATSNGHGVNRGVLESLLFTNDAIDANGQVFFIYIDDVVFHAPEADPVTPPTIVEPILRNDPTVTVQNISTNATEIRLKVDNGTDPDLTTNGGGLTSFTFTLPHPATAGDTYTATQTVGGVASADSIPVTVTFPGPVIGLLPKDGDTSVRISQIDPNADQVELFVEGLSQGTAPTVGAVTTVEVPTLAALDMGQQVTATMTVTGAVSDSSPVAIVTTNGIAPAALCDDFEYASQAAFDAVWQPTLGDTQLVLSDFWNATPGGTKSALSSAAGANRSQLIANFAATAGTDTHPIIWSLHFYDDSSNYSLYRQYAELRGDAGAILALGKYNATPTGSATHYSARIVGGGVGWFALNDPGAPTVSPGWHTLTAVIKSSTIDYYVDGTLARLGMSRTAGAALNTALLGSGLTSTGGAAWYDDLCVEVGALHFPPVTTQPPPPPTVTAPILPGAISVTVTDINTNAEAVTLLRNGGAPDIRNPGGLATFVFPIAPAVGGDVYTATQTLGGLTSHVSDPVTVLLPAPTLHRAPTQGDTSVRVVDVNTNASLVEVKVGGIVRGSATPPPGAASVDVPLTAYTLTMGEEVTARMTVGGTLSVDSAPDTVTTDVPGATIWCDDFEYVDQAAFNVNWSPIATQMILSTDRNATPGGQKSMQALASGTYRSSAGAQLGALPTDTQPVVWSINIFDETAGTGVNQYADLNNLASDFFLAEIGISNFVPGGPETHYQARLVGNGGPNWFELDQSEGPTRSVGWHTFTMVFKGPAPGATLGHEVDVYVDGLLSAKNVGITIDNTTLREPRIGSGQPTTAGAHFDDYCAQVGPVTFPTVAPQPPNKPAVNSPVEAGDTVVSVGDVGPDATLVTVYANAVPIGTFSDPAGTNGVVTVPVTTLVHLNAITADQTNAVGTSLASDALEVGKGNGDIRICVGIRETGDLGPLGSMGGGIGPIEWVGATGVANGAPQGIAITPSSSWQPLTFDPSVPGQVTGFTGNGIIDGLRGTLEHLAVAVNAALPNRSTGAYTLYVDNVVNVGADAGADFTIADFEANSNGQEVLFQEPTNSGSTFPAHLVFPPSASEVTSAQASGGVRSAILRWFWKDTSAQRWARITTTDVPFVPRPIIDITKPIRMDVLLVPTCQTVSGDLDGDGDADLADLGGFVGCLNGPLTDFAPGCECADFNGDRKVDLADFAEYQLGF